MAGTMGCKAFGFVKIGCPGGLNGPSCCRGEGCGSVEGLKPCASNAGGAAVNSERAAAMIRNGEKRNVYTRLHTRR